MTAATTLASVVPVAADAAAAASEQPPRVAVVTGGARGIGLGIAKCLARDGYTGLVLGYNSNAAAAEAAAAELRSAHAGLQVELVGGDLALPATADALFDRVNSHFGGHITAFVHNAGLFVGRTSVSEAQPQPTGDGRKQDWEAVWNYYHSVYVLAFKRCLLRALGCQPGGLRHVLAISAQGCNATQGPRVQYEAPGQGKAGLEYLVRLHARQLAPAGINVNAIVPGHVATEAWQKLGAPPEAMQRAVESTPAQRWAQPEEIGEVAAFLCSPRASFLTGASIPVDGGQHLNVGP